ncbi:MAG: SDR family NAD(P)-dependent oxidoreductase, partial [Candidatus Acidiferrum sp.]
RKCIAVQADVSISADVDRLVKTVENELGPVGILVNNAGIGKMIPADQVTEEIWNQYLRVNLTSVFLVTQRVLPGMRAAHWGRIINLSSIAAQYGGIVGPHYSATKAGILGLTRSYASQFAKEGITVNAIAPALIETDMVAGLPKDLVSRIPVGAMGSADEVGRIAVLLAESSFITGQTINPNGGMYMS